MIKDVDLTTILHLIGLAKANGYETELDIVIFVVMYMTKPEQSHINIGNVVKFERRT